ncbi:MAG: flavodoxin family protein [Planctomycetota bacterium]|jgi:putative NADPH-quinone reductase
MKVLAINGSPRGPASNTRRLLAPLLEGMREEGAEVEELYLTDLDVRPCTGCFSCWVKTPGRCIQQDDVAGLHEKMLASDVLVLGFGLYIGSAPAKVQALLERMLPLAEPWLVEMGGATGHPSRHAGKSWRWAVVCNCGFPEQEQFGPLAARLGQLGVQPIAMAAGEFLAYLEGAPELAEPLAALRSGLREAGKELARTGDISQERRAKLSRPVIAWAGVTAEQYREFGNAAFRGALEELGAPGDAPAP